MSTLWILLGIWLVVCGATVGDPVASKSAEALEHYQRGEAVVYKELVIHPAPERDGNRWRVAGVIVKQSGNVEMERVFTRADTFATREEAEILSVQKARQIIDERGAALFADGKATGRA